MESRWCETNWNRDGLRLKSDNLRRGCRLQDRGAVQGRSKSRQRVVAHRRGGRDARLARGGMREHDAFLGHEMRGPAGTGRRGVSMAGGREGHGARKRNGVGGHCLQLPPCFVYDLLIHFGFLSRWGRLLANIRSVYSYMMMIAHHHHHIHEFLYISNLFHFIYFPVKHMSNI